MIVSGSFRRRKSALILAEGYNHELLKSEAEMLEELERALGEALPQHLSYHPFQGEKTARLARA